MTRICLFMNGLLMCALLAALACADDPKKLTAEERKQLETKWKELNKAGGSAYESGKYPDSHKKWEEALQIARQLYPASEFPDGHEDLAVSLSNLALVASLESLYALAEPLNKEALAMFKRLFKGDNAKLADCMNNLALLYSTQGQYARAEALYQDALAMNKRLFEGDHLAVAQGLNSLAQVYYAQGKYADAEPLYRDALAMYRRLYQGDHPSVAQGLNDLAALHMTLGRLAAAETLYRESLAMYKRLHQGDHPFVATSLNNLAEVYEKQGKLSLAEPLYVDSLAMTRRIFKGDHPDIVNSLIHLGYMYYTQGKVPEAERLLKEALEMSRRLFKGDHSYVAASLSYLARLYDTQGKLADAETMYKESAAMYQRLFKGDHPEVARSLIQLSRVYSVQGKFADAESMAGDALAMLKRVFKGDHPAVNRALVQLAVLYKSQGKLAEAEPLYREGLAMSKRMFKGNHPTVATCQKALAELLAAQGKLAEAEPLWKEVLESRYQIFKGDHPEVAHSMHDLAYLYLARGKYAEAESMCDDALAMTRRLYKTDHPEVADSLTGQAAVYIARKKYADAEAVLQDALAMRQRLFKDDHPSLATNLRNLAHVERALGKYREAESLSRSDLAMTRRMLHINHPRLADSLSTLADQYRLQGNYADAVPLYLEALVMERRFIQMYAEQKAEGESLTYLASLPQTRDGFISATRQSQAVPRAVYSELWTSKGLVARVYEQRLLAARAAVDLTAAKLLAERSDARRRRAELLLAPHLEDPATRQKHDDELNTIEKKISELERALLPLLPTIDRAAKQAKATPAELQAVLPKDVAVVDFLRYRYCDNDRNKPGWQGESNSERYLAFVLTWDRIAWVDLDSAEKIDAAVNAWREAITSGVEIPAIVSSRVRELVWEKVRKELPAGIKTIYLSPDAALCRVPWSALPGDKPGSILLEDFAVAVIPHAPFLLDKFSSHTQRENTPTRALIVGGVKYDAQLASPSTPPLSRGDPLVKPDATLGWGFLPGTVGELNGVDSLAARTKIAATRLEGAGATPAKVLAELPKMKYAHFATHGFFADPSFRGLFQLDEKDYEKSAHGERIGRAVNSPLVMTGLVFAGANNPNTPGRGILTGESLIDLDLSGLELAVLSACETGLGDVAGGEGTFGLQRAFHMAGTRNVVASLWKVPDQSTAALMALFYRNLWEKDLSPMESLRQAQLEIYRNPGKIGELATGFRGKFEEVAGKGTVEIKPSKDGTAHPLLWAAFTLSGPGR